MHSFLIVLISNCAGRPAGRPAGRSAGRPAGHPRGARVVSGAEKKINYLIEAAPFGRLDQMCRTAV